MPTRRHLIILSLVTVTTVNLAMSGFSLYRFGQHQSATPLNSTTVLKSAKQQDVDETKQGRKLGTANYQSETVKSSKLENGDEGQLMVASHNDEGHFVMAVSGYTTDLASKLGSGWTLQKLATDRLWEPGACASKPSYLLQQHYVFIDDGKTKPTDRYNSYVVYDITAGSYRYFGGDHFTDQQGQHEKVIKVANENDRLVFYIDLTDDSGPLAGSPTFKHLKGNDHRYIVRRVIDMADFSYTDYKLDFSLPESVSYYYIDFGYGGEVIFHPDGGTTSYSGTIANNRLEVQPTKAPAITTDVVETDLEKQLSASLQTQLAGLLGTTNPVGYSTKFSIKELGSGQGKQYLIAQARSTGSETPFVYDQHTQNIDVMVSEPVLSNNYVALGVY